MPLDLKKVIPQIKKINNSSFNNLSETLLRATLELFSRVAKNQDKLSEKLLTTKESKKASFFFAIPANNEDLETLILHEQSFRKPHVVIASDGSQINSSNHEITSSFLINIGLTAIPYFAKEIPVCLNSEPTVYSSYEDITQKSIGEIIQNEDLISYERTIKEVEGLVKIAQEYVKHKLPIVALLDGTLIHWHIEKFSNTFIEEFICRFSNAISELKSLGIPVASFLSNSRSNELINMLRIFNCPYEEVDCKKYCSSLDVKKLPCNPINDYIPVLDRRLIERIFKKQNMVSGARTSLFRSTSKILNYYPDDLKVLFFYINTDSEVARVEIPAYVAESKELLALVHNAVALQCSVGYGYPVSLGEAHLQAVVTKADRDVFYDLLKDQLLKEKKSPLKLSNKELKKRISFV